MIQLFHGSDVGVENPKVEAGRTKVDFGKGFYLSSLSDQEDYENGIITAEQALGQLRYKKVNHQVCLHNQDVVDRFLRFQSSEGIPRAR